MPSSRSLSRYAGPAIGLAVFVFAHWWCSTGIAWSVGFHPDEFPVGRWIDQVRDEGYIVERPYPGGWFELARIGLWAENLGRSLGESTERHRAQDGFVSALSEHSFRPASPPRTGKRSHDIQWGRDFNVWLYALTALFLYLGALEAGLGVPGASVSALFFLFSPFVLEHAHYCETDPGVLATLALTLWLLVRAARKASPPLAAAAGFAAGFCVSCKYTVGSLLLCPAILAAVLAAERFRGRGGPRRIGGSAGFAALALAAAAAGFLVGTPVLFHDMPMVLDALRTNPQFQADPATKIGALFRESAKLGLLPLAWLAFSFAFWLRRPWRSRFAGPLAFPVLFFLYVLVVLPWFRNQELLPLACTLCLGAGLPVAAAVRAGIRRSPVRAVATFVALVAALGAAGLGSGRMLRCFALRDTRAECQNFLAASFPRGGAIVLEGYVSQVVRGVPEPICAPEGFVAERWPESAGDESFVVSGARYLVRNATQPIRQGSPLFERFSGRPKPETARAVEAFRRETTLLRAWTLPPGSVRPVFAQPDVELRLLPPAEAGSPVPDIAIPFPRPTLLLPHGFPLYDASGAAWFGPRRALPTVGKRGTIRLSRDGAPRWAVTRLPTTAPEGGTPVRVNREGPYRPASSPLAPGGVAVAAVRPSWLQSTAPCLFPKTRIRIRGDDQTNAAFTFLASDPAEAALELRRAGDAAGALALLREAGGMGGGGVADVEAFLDAVAAGVPPEPEWADAARRALAAWDALRVGGRNGTAPADDGAAALCGVPLRALRDFSRIRIPDLPLAPRVAIPVCAPPGDYAVECRVGPALAGRLAGLLLFEGQLAPFTREDGPDGGESVLRATIRHGRDGFVRFTGDAPDPSAGEHLCIPLFELSWDPLELASGTAEQIRRASTEKTGDSP